MIKRFFLNFLALFFPWAIMLIYDNPLAFVFTILMQATLIGWIPASMWAWKIVHAHEKPAKAKP